jgi:hypothetical protein
MWDFFTDNKAAVFLFLFYFGWHVFKKGKKTAFGICCFLNGRTAQSFLDWQLTAYLSFFSSNKYDSIDEAFYEEGEPEFTFSDFFWGKHKLVFSWAEMSWKAHNVKFDGMGHENKNKNKNKSSKNSGLEFKRKYAHHKWVNCTFQH